MTDIIILSLICLLLVYSIFRIYLYIMSGQMYSTDSSKDSLEEPIVEEINRYRAENQTINAFNLAKKYITENPRSEKARLIYAQVISDAGKHYDAIGHLNILLKNNPKNIEALNILADCYNKTKQPKKATTIYKQILEIDSQNSLALRKLAQQYYYANEKREAIALYKKLASNIHDPDEHLEIKLNIINMYTELKDWDNVIKEARTLVEQHPNNKSLLLYLRKAFQTKNDIINTVEITKKLIEMEPLHPKYYEEIVALLHKLNDLEFTAKYAKEALELKSVNKSLILNLLSQTYMKNNQLDDALEIIKKAIKNDYKNVDLKKTLADLYCQKNDYESAIQIYENLIESVHPSEVPDIKLCLSNVFYKYGNYYHQLNRYQDAFSKFNKAIEYDGSNPEFYITIAELNYKIKNYGDAAKNYKIAISLDPKNSSYYLTIANMYYESGNILEAKKYYIETIQIDPESVVAHTKLGIIYAKQQTPQNAIEEFTKALKLDPNNVDIRYNLALAYEISNNISKAIEEYRNVLEINPEHTESRNNLDLLLNIY